LNSHSGSDKIQAYNIEYKVVEKLLKNKVHPPNEHLQAREESEEPQTQMEERS
jgi:hypothetical protein